MKIDYLSLVITGWEEIDIQISVCSICGKKGLCKIMKKEHKILAVCEDCFVDDTDRHYPYVNNQEGCYEIR